jgi:hypothetical protein
VKWNIEVIKRRHHGAGTYTKILTYKDSVETCNQRSVVIKANESFLPGNYSYPFTFQVPSGIPGTYGHESGNQSNRARCSSSYMVYVELVMNGEADEDRTIGRAMCPIIITQKARNPINYNLPANIDSKVTTWGCIDRGNISVNCLFEKDVVTMTDCISMKFNIDNSKSKVSIKNLNAVLKRKLRIKSIKGLVTYRENDMIKVSIPGCSAGDKIDEKVVLLDLKDAKDIEAPAYLRGALAEFAGKMQQTCNGKLINCKYELHISAVVDGCTCCEKHPHVFTPFEILVPERVLKFTQHPYPVESSQPVEGKEYADGVQATKYPQAPSPDFQNPQLQYADASSAQLGGEVQTKDQTNHLTQENMYGTPMDRI